MGCFGARGRDWLKFKFVTPRLVEKVIEKFKFCSSGKTPKTLGRTLSQYLNPEGGLICVVYPSLLVGGPNGLLYLREVIAVSLIFFILLEVC